MIIDRLHHASQYIGSHERLAAGMRYLQETDLTRVAPGKYEIDGENVYAMVQEYETKPMEKGRWEAHRKYMDIQYVAAGEEHMGYTNLDHLKVGEYDTAKDFLSLEGEGNFLRMTAGMFVIFAPQDAHMPGMVVDTPKPVKKVVVKVKI